MVSDGLILLAALLVSLILPAADSHQEETSKATAFAFENRQAINEKFADLLTNVCKRMVENGVDVDEFRLFTVALFPPGDCIPQSPTNLTKVFEAITRHGLWDSLHYSPLVRIVRKFGASDPEMEAWIRDYKKDLRAYTLLTTVEDCIESELVASAEPPPAEIAKYDSRYCCPVEWKTDFDDHTLHYLADVLEMFSDRYLLPDSPATALLDRVRRGCISVVWLVPSYLIPQLLKIVQVDTTFFRKHHILKVTVGGEVVYEEVSSVCPKYALFIPTLSSDFLLEITYTCSYKWFPPSSTLSLPECKQQ